MDLDFINAEDGYLFVKGWCSASCVLVTDDGGRSWRATTLPATGQLVNGNNSVYALAAYSAHRAPELFRNIPGQRAWTRLSLPTASTATPVTMAAEQDTIAFVQQGQGIAVTPTQLGRIWISADDGAHWLRRVNPCRQRSGGAALVGIALDHPNALLLDCYNGEQSEQEQQTQQHLYGSGNAGKSWRRLADPSDTGAPELLTDNGAGHAFLVTAGGFGYQLRVSLNGAHGWHTALSGGSGGFAMGDLRFVSARVGFVLGPTNYSPEHLYRTEDAGYAWHELKTPAP